MNGENVKLKDTLIIGFALFAMFFGAGNLIFPPALGVLTGYKWWIAFIGFLFADGGLSFLVVVAQTKYNGDMDLFFARIGKVMALIMGTAIVICIGPLIAVPRTAATTYEVGILPTIGPGFNRVIFSIIFFAVTLALTIRPSKVVDIVGQFLTPALLVGLLVLIIKGISSPLGDIRQSMLIDTGALKRGIYEGYQTLDALGAFVYAGIVISAIVAKGYTNEKAKIKATITSGFIAVLGMTIVYGGLSYLGATVSMKYGADIDQTALLVAITEALLGGPGKVILAVIVSLACLTTAIGVTSSCGHYFSRITNGKLTYEIVVIAVCIFSTIVSNLGVSEIINFALPILLIVYPASLTVVLLTFFSKYIKNNNVYKLSTYVVLIMSIVVIGSGLLGHPEIGEMADKLPLGSYGFYWVTPAIVAAIIGNFIPERKKMR